MKHRLLTYAALAALALPALAIPAKHITTTGSTLDGETLTVTLQGNEDFHWYQAPDGRRFLMDNGVLTPLPARPAKAPSKRLPGLVPDNEFPRTGNQRGIAILVEYQDVRFTIDNPREYFDRLLNEEGYSENYATGSARDWYVDNSQGKFTPTFDVYGPVLLQNRRSYYGGNDAFGQDNNPQKMVIEACRQLNPDVDFTPYDGDNDGVLDNVFIFYAGRGEASSNESDAIWPHAWYVKIAEPGTKYIFDGKQLDRYACGNELEMSDVEGRGICPAGIGTFVHEFNHVLGLPDLYNTGYSDDGIYTAWHWSVMDYGPYLNEGHTPPMFSSYERSALGWGEPEELPTSPSNLAMKPIGEGGNGYKITLSDTESYVVENRQPVGWDTYLPAHGLLAWHINYDPHTWDLNVVNNTPGQQGVILVPADDWANYDEQRKVGLPGATYPGTTGRTELTLNNIRISDITEASMPHDPGRLAFRVNGGAPDIAAPQDVNASDVECDHVKLSWAPVQGAKGYVVTLDEITGIDHAPSENGDALTTPISYYSATNSFETTQVKPWMQYSASVVTDDGVFGSAPTEEITFTTPQPSLKYETPHIEAIEVVEDNFSIRYSVMNDAEKYEIALATALPGEPVNTILDFTDGIEGLPQGWATTATGVYGMASYAGVSAPSLRFSADGQYIESPLMDRNIEKVLFWARGNGTQNARFDVTCANNTDEEIAMSKPLLNDQGMVYEYDLLSPVRQIRVMFHTDKGSAAFDDLTLVMTGDENIQHLSGYPVTTTQGEYHLEGLKPGTPYRVYVTAINSDGMRSLQGSLLVTTPKAGSLSTIEAAAADGSAEWFDLQGRRINRPSAPGLYIMRAAGKTLKVKL